MANIVLRHKAGELKEVLEYVQATGKNVKGENVDFIKDCLLVVSKNKVHVEAIDENEALIVVIDLTTDEGLKQTPGNIPLELGKAIKALARFKSDDVVSVNYSDNFVEFVREKPKLRERVPTIGEGDVESVIKELPFNIAEMTFQPPEGDVMGLHTRIEIESAEFAEIVKDGEQIQNRLFPISISGGVATVMVENVDTGELIERQLDAKKVSAKVDVSSMYSQGFGNAFGNLSGAVEIFLCQDGPMVAVKKAEHFTLHYFVAHSSMSEDEEEEEEEEPEEEPEEKPEGKSKKSGKKATKKAKPAEEDEEAEESTNEAEAEEETEDEEEPPKKGTKT
jgi:hypothetical protein